MPGLSPSADTARRPETAHRFSSLRTVSGLGSVLAVAALALVTATAGSPSAAADVVNVEATPGLSWGPSTRFGTNCGYTLTATVTTAEPVTFYDFDPASTFSPSNYIYPTNGVATVTWTPKQPGGHRILVHQVSGIGPTMDIEVGIGINAGSACLVLP